MATPVANFHVIPPPNQPAQSHHLQPIVFKTHTSPRNKLPQPPNSSRAAADQLSYQNGALKSRELCDLKNAYISQPRTVKHINKVRIFLNTCSCKYSKLVTLTPLKAFICPYAEKLFLVKFCIALKRVGAPPVHLFLCKFLPCIYIIIYFILCISTRLKLITPQNQPHRHLI